MFYADRVGLADVYDRIRQFERDFGERWTPAPLLAELARETFGRLSGTWIANAP